MSIEIVENAIRYAAEAVAAGDPDPRKTAADRALWDREAQYLPVWIEVRDGFREWVAGNVDDDSLRAMIDAATPRTKEEHDRYERTYRRLPPGWISGAEDILHDMEKWERENPLQAKVRAYMGSVARLAGVMGYDDARIQALYDIPDEAVAEARRRWPIDAWIESARLVHETRKVLMANKGLSKVEKLSWLECSERELRLIEESGGWHGSDDEAMDRLRQIHRSASRTWAEVLFSGGVKP